MWHEWVALGTKLVRTPLLFLSGYYRSRASPVVEDSLIDTSVHISQTSSGYMCCFWWDVLVWARTCLYVSAYICAPSFCCITPCP